jgi:DNA-directed RNA polymerase subunit RPC12/RpoP
MVVEREDIREPEVDALCRECGHAFKAFVDRIVPDNSREEAGKDIRCPVCGCGECRIGR